MADTNRADTILALDIGSATTRAALFDVVEGVHRFVASAEAPSTAEAPYKDCSEGVHHAVRDLESLTGRSLLDSQSQVIMPGNENGNGVDVLVGTLSAGPAVRTLLVGLLPEVSLENARQIAASAYCAIVEAFSLGDHRHDYEQLDAAVAAQPNLLVVSGGTDGGAKDALFRQLETANIACNLLPPGQKPYVLYIGNPALKPKVARLFGEAVFMHTAANVQPALGDEARVLAPARAELANIFHELRQAQLGGLARLAQMGGGFPFQPTALAEGQMVQHLSRALGKSVLSANVGAAASSLIAAPRNASMPYINVRPDLGLGTTATKALSSIPLTNLTRWLPADLPATAGERSPEGLMSDFVFNKSIHPRSLPADLGDLYFELALAREILRANLRQARPNWPATVRSAEGLPAFDVIIGGGAALGQAPHPGLAALALLDALEPSGFVQALLLDEHHLLPALGALAAINPLAVAQILEGEPFPCLGAAVCASGWARAGEKICQAKLTRADGTEAAVDLKYGGLEILPLPLGQRGKLTLKPRGGIDVGFGPGRGATREVSGGTVGVILDGRGRPIAFSDDPAQRRAAVQQWIERVSNG
jgi:hypothetical protein